MLENLLIRNIALFAEAKIQFGPGLHVLTGETGAGKSLVVDAVNFLCGAKADRDLIRTGSETAYVEGLFLIDGQDELANLLESQEIATEDGQLIIAREMNRKGRNIYRVNGMACAHAIYQELTARLIDLHGQHEHQSLLNDAKQLKFLDLLGDSNHETLLKKTKASFQELSEVRKAYEDALASSRTRGERFEILHIRKKELEDAKLVSGEDERLQEEKSLLRNAEKIGTAIQEADSALSGSGGTDSVLSLLGEAQAAMERISAFNLSYGDIAKQLQALYYELEEVSHELKTQAKAVYQDDNRLEEVETRLDLLRKLQRKYGPDSEAMLKVLAEIETELNQFETLDDVLGGLQESLANLEKDYQEKSEALSRSREKLARHYEQRIESVLHDLNMSGTRFAIQLSRDRLRQQPSGIDQVTMMIAPNAGEMMKPISKIASGGELSRVMLAMKTLAAEKNEVPTMVFDEIDTGVSGSTAMVIAQKLWAIARFRQVICVSHLHQLAAMASSQYHVSKNETDGRTMASIRALGQEERVKEIAKMLGDINTQGQSGMQHALVLLEDAAAYRKTSQETLE